MENNVTAILLAGGKSERMGTDKGLLPFNNSFWILEQLKRIAKTNIKTVFIGLGYNYKNYFDKIVWLEYSMSEPFKFYGLNIQTIINKHPENGSFSTLQKVLKNTASNQEVLINHIDIPYLNTTELNKIINDKNWITIPRFQNKNGHPIKLKGIVWKDLIQLDPLDQNSRLDLQLKKIASSKKSFIDVLDEAISLNLNTPKSWELFIKQSKFL